MCDVIHGPPSPTLARKDRAGVAAAHGDDHVGGLDGSGGDDLGRLVGEVDADLGHGLDSSEVTGSAGTEPRSGPRWVCWMAAPTGVPRIRYPRAPRPVARAGAVSRSGRSGVGRGPRGRGQGPAGVEHVDAPNAGLESCRATSWTAGRPCRLFPRGDPLPFVAVRIPAEPRRPSTERADVYRQLLHTWPSDVYPYGERGPGPRFSVRGIRSARWSSGPRCGPTDESSAPRWSVRRTPTHERLTLCGH